jgi:hypothetical protein
VVFLESPVDFSEVLKYARLSKWRYSQLHACSSGDTNYFVGVFSPNRFALVSDYIDAIELPNYETLPGSSVSPWAALPPRIWQILLSDRQQIVFDYTGNMSLLMGAVNANAQVFSVCLTPSQKKMHAKNFQQLASDYLTNPAPFKDSYWEISPSNTPEKGDTKSKKRNLSPQVSPVPSSSGRKTLAVKNSQQSSYPASPPRKRKDLGNRSSRPSSQSSYTQISDDEIQSEDSSGNNENEFEGLLSDEDMFDPSHPRYDYFKDVSMKFPRK